MPSLDELRGALGQLAGEVVALDPRYSQQIVPLIADIAQGRDVPDSRLTAALGGARSDEMAGSRVIPVVANGKGVAVVSMRGVALYNLEFQPYCFSTKRLADTVSEFADDNLIGRIVIVSDTPGGHVTGTQEAADAVHKASRKKPVVGIIDPLCASAGYWIGSQCTKLIAVPSADVGSIGVFMCHYDYSKMLANVGVRPTFIYAGKHKTDGNAMEPLSDEARAFWQSEVNQIHDDFLSAVARGRGVSREAVLARFGQGRCYAAPVAKRLGMVDAVAPYAEAFRSAVAAPVAETGLRSNQSLAESMRRRLALEALR